MKFILAQIGARKNYVALRALAEAGMLERFYTDLYYSSDHSKFVANLIAIAGNKRVQKAITSRSCGELEGLPVTDFPLFSVINRLAVTRGVKNGKKFVSFLKGGRKFSSLVASHGFKSAQGIYAFSSAALEIFEQARESGVCCILDHETPPALLEIELVKSGAENYDGWLPEYWNREPEAIQQYQERQMAEGALADKIICPSSFARKLVIQSGASAQKTVVLPFAMDDRFRHPNRLDVKFKQHKELRVLFLGNDAIRKGLPDLVAAIQMLDSRSIVSKGGGAWNLTKHGRDACKGVIEPLGGVPRNQTPEMYQWADVLVLPTLSDAMAVVILEAMASGVPVIATEASGGPDIIRDGLDGFVVPVNNPDVIADKLELLALQSDLLEIMSLNAIKRADEFGLDVYRRKLLALLKAEDCKS